MVMKKKTQEKISLALRPWLAAQPSFQSLGTSVSSCLNNITNAVDLWSSKPEGG
jgi:hypothetical protein